MKSDKQTQVFLKRLGKRIKELRKEQNLSQGQLAYESGLRRETIGNIERGEQSPSVENLYAIARTLQIRVGNLFDFEIKNGVDAMPASRAIEQSHPGERSNPN